MTTSQRSLPRSQRSNKYSQEYAGRVVSRQSGTRRRGVIRLFHGAARYNQVFHAIDSLTPLSLSHPSLDGIKDFSSDFFSSDSPGIVHIPSLSLFLDRIRFRSKRFNDDRRGIGRVNYPRS